MGRRDYRDVTQRKPKTKGKGDELIDWTIQDLRDRWDRTSKGALKFKDQLLYGMDSTPSEVSQPKRRRITDIPSQEERWRIEEEEVQKALGQDAQGKTIEPSSFDPFRTEMDSMFKRLIENPDFTDQQKFPSLKAMYSLQNSWFDEAYQEPTYSHAIAFTEQAEKEKNNQLIESQPLKEITEKEIKHDATADQNKEKKVNIGGDNDKSDGQNILQQQGEVLDEPSKTSLDARMARRDRRLEDKKAEGRPLERLRLEKARNEGLGKLINDEFEKNRV